MMLNEKTIVHTRIENETLVPNKEISFINKTQTQYPKIDNTRSIILKL